ncbi:MAG TPA: ATP-binding protein [Brevundimonas sp.]|jgi:signal transduction histidine kinase/PAS domain-containing protein
MLLEGEVDWVLVLSVIAGVMTVLALFSSWFAYTHRERHVSTSGELNHVQKVVAETDKRLFETLNAIPVAIVQTDMQGKFVFANKAAHQLMGRRDAELLGLRFHSATWGITFPDGRPIPPDMLPSARALRGQTVRGFQHILANPATRRKMLVCVTAMPIENEYGQIIGSTAAVVETEGLTTPEAAIAPERVLPHPDTDLTGRVFESASSRLVVVSPHGVVRVANAAALRQLDRTDSIVGDDFADQFLAEDQRLEARHILRAALTAKTGLGTTTGQFDRIFARGAGGATVVWRILPLLNSDGVIDALLLAGDELDAEIEPRPAGDSEVAAADALEYQGTPELTPEPMEAGADTSEAARDHAHGLQAVEIETHPGAHGSTDSAGLDALRDERDAAVSHAEEALSQLHAARAEAETAMAEADRISARARAEDDRARRFEDVGRLSSGMAQDFNALISVMTSALDMMLKQADDPSRVRRLGQAALAAGQRGETMTRRLAALSVEETGGARTLDCGVLLRAMEGRLRSLAGPGIDLMIEGPSSSVPVRIDPVAFEATVRALVTNAVEAVGGAGSVAVRLETTSIGARLSVRDTGPGMDGDTIPRAAEPFFTTKSGAAGMGLAQARAFARQSGGALTIDSTPGEGAEVAVTLPPDAD